MKNYSIRFFVSFVFALLFVFPAFAESPKFVPNEILVEMATDDAGIIKSPREGSLVKALFQKHGTPAIRPIFHKIGGTPSAIYAHLLQIKQKNAKRFARAPQKVTAPPLHRFFKLTFPSDVDIMEIIKNLKADPNIKSVSPNYFLTLNSTTPNDPYFSSSGSWGQSYDDMWGLKQIDVENAWDVTTGDSSVIVAVLDSGLDMTHVDIVDNLYSNSAESSGTTGVDDDLNGYVDDVNGYDFCNTDADPTDDNGHGTHVSGTIAAVGDNGTGVTGMMWQASVMPVKVCRSSGSCSLSDIAEGLTYAADMGADVINMSFGGLSSNTTSLEAAIEYAYDAGVVLIAAAGNDSTDASIHYPSAYNQVISVAASTTLDTLSSFSNYGIDIDFSAPGGGDGSGNSTYERNILSLLAAGTDLYDDSGQEVVGVNYYRAQGTSMASPYAAGLAGLLLSHDSTYTVEEVRQIMRQSADDIGDVGWDLEAGYGRINAASALNSAQACEAIILSPNNYSVENASTLTVTGSAGGRSFASYTLEIGAGGSPANWRNVSSGTTSISAATLGTYSTSQMIGLYTLRLKVYDFTGNVCGTDYKAFQFSSISETATLLEPTSSSLTVGYSLAAGDINGDGFDDLLIGAPGCLFCYNTPTVDGQVFLVYGNSSAITSGSSYLSSSTVAPASWLTDEIEDRMGVSVAVADIDGDDFGDVVIGAPGSADNGSLAGKICIFLGRTSETWTTNMSLDDANYCFYGEAADDLLGFYVENGGDLDHDGLDEIVTSACGNDEGGSSYGKAYVLYGQDFASWSTTDNIDSVAGTSFIGSESISYFCSSTYQFGTGFKGEGIGDFNGDGFDDLALGFYPLGYSGSLHLFYGSSDKIASGSITAADVIIENDGDEAIVSDISAAGDLNGDQLADVAVASSGNMLFGDIPPNARIVYGDTLLSGSYAFSEIDTPIFYGSSLYEVPTALAGLGDINGDDIDDIALGVAGYNLYDGVLEILFGDPDWMDTGLLLNVSNIVTEGNYMTGYSITSGDFDGDGLQEVATSVVNGYTKIYIYSPSDFIIDDDSVDNDWDGYTENDSDCNDFNGSVYPAAAETCDNRDNNCDGNVDEGVQTTYYADDDGDGYGDVGVSNEACAAPDDYVTDNTDCNDSSASAYPGRTETCDNIDNNCDGSIDEGVTTTYYQDSDSDNYGNASVTQQACSRPTGYVSNSTDCNDSSSSISPSRTEVCDGVDNDCDGSTDEGVTTTYYQDSDGDSRGNPSATQAACSRPTGYVTNSNDCNDSSALAYTGRSESCDGVDNDCDGSTDEGVTTTYYQDSDGDNYGNSSVSQAACSRPTGYVTNSNDCNDSSALAYTGRSESCDSVDNDCDGSIDEGLTTRTYYRDSDSDTYGDLATSQSACSLPSGYVTNSSDCNDNSSLIKPGASESCDGVDNDCDSSIDEGLTFRTYYIDVDGDTYGSTTTTQSACSAPTGYVTNSNDCNDGNAAINALAVEICGNSIDENCDGTDESCPVADEEIGAEGETTPPESETIPESENTSNEFDNESEETADAGEDSSDNGDTGGDIPSENPTDNNEEEVTTPNPSSGGGGCSLNFETSE